MNKTRTRIIFFSFLAIIFSPSIAFGQIKYESLDKAYDREAAPDGFIEFSKKHGVENPNTCAVRLSHGLFKVDASFFKDVKAQSGIEWLGLVVRADDLAIILNKKIKKGVLIKTQQDIKNKRGIVFFDKLEGWSGGTGHISLWDGKAVTDQKKDGGKNFFSRGERIYFWQLD